MARTESSMRELGTPAPDFELPDTVSGEVKSFEDIAGSKATVVMFICNHCPFVKHILKAIVDFARDYHGPETGIVAISANDAENYPDDAPGRMRELAEAEGFNFPYLHDDSQDTARAYDAACTPDFFVFDGEHRLVYRGRFDGASPGNKEPVTGKDLRAALDAVLAGREVRRDQKPSVGCNIKWK